MFIDLFVEFSHKYDTKTELKEIRREGVNWIDLAQDRDSCRAAVNTVVNIRVLYNVGNVLTS